LVSFYEIRLVARIILEGVTATGLGCGAYDLHVNLIGTSKATTGKRWLDQKEIYPILYFDAFGIAAHSSRNTIHDCGGQDTAVLLGGRFP
jgi:hypothetical protein